MMNCIYEEQEEDDSLSGKISFPSLQDMYTQDEEHIHIIPPDDDDATTSSDEIGGVTTKNQNDVDCATTNFDEMWGLTTKTTKQLCVGAQDMDDTNMYGTNYPPMHNLDDYDNDDGYPTDEHSTIQSLTRSKKEKERKRLTILQLARDRLAKKTSGDADVDINIPTDINHDLEQQAADDSSFLANVDVADVENNIPDDSTFLNSADVEDVPTPTEDDIDRSPTPRISNFNDVETTPRISNFGDVENDMKMNAADANSYYDIYASTLSRASASTRADTIGDQILKESNMAARFAASSNNNSNANMDTNINNGAENNGADNQSATSNYSYRRAYVDSVTLGSNYTSTCSALTDEYCFDARKMVGMSEAITRASIQEDHQDHDNDNNNMINNNMNIQRNTSFPVDADTGAMIHPSPSDNNSQCVESLARPPPPNLSNNQSPDFRSYENPEHLTRIVAFGGEGGGEGGKGWVDERAAHKFENGSAGGCCGWFTTSSRMVKLIVLFSILLMFISITSLALAFLMPREEIVMMATESPNGKTATGVPTMDKDEKNYDNNNGSEYDFVEDASRQNNDTETLVPSASPTPAPFVVQSTSGPASLSPEGASNTVSPITVASTSSIIATAPAPSKSPESFIESPEGASTVSPTATPTSSIIATLAPSKSPDPFIYSTSDITNSTTKQPSSAPMVEPSKEPTDRPTYNPTKRPTKQPSIEPTPSPQQPTEEPTYNPSRKPTKKPTVKPTQVPTANPSNRPTTPIPTEFPIFIGEPTVSPASPPSSLATTPTPTSTQTVTLRSIQDTYVNTTAPDENYGSEKQIRVDGSPRCWAFLEFDTTSIIENAIQVQRQSSQPADQNEPRNLQTLQVLKAKLRLYTLDEGGGGVFFALPNARDWSDKGLTWDKMGDQIDRGGEFRVFSTNWFDTFRWYEIDVTDAFLNFGPNTVRSFLIKSYSTNGVAFASKEKGLGKFSPELVLTFPSDVELGTSLPNAPTLSPSRPPSKKPTQNIFFENQPDNLFPWQPVTADPIRFPTPKPSRNPTPSPTRRPTTRAPHKRPLRPSRSPTTSPSPTTDAPTNTIAANGIRQFVPPGCPTTVDINFAVKEAMLPQERTFDMHIVFPSQDSYVRGGIYSDENYGSSDDLVLRSSTTRILFEFDLDLDDLSSSMHNVVSITLRLFVDSVGDDKSISIYKLPTYVQLEEDQVTWNNFGTPAMEKAGPTFQVASSDGGKWIDVDITDLFDGGSVNKFLLAVKDASTNSEARQCVIASRETCHSSKLVIITESNND